MRNGEKECEKLYLMLQKDDNERITIMDKDANYEIVLNTEILSGFHNKINRDTSRM